MDTIQIPTLATVSAPPHRHLKTDIDDPMWMPVRDTMVKFIETHSVSTHISTLAPGFDQLVASIAHWMGRDIVVIRPFPDHERPWPPRARENAELLMAVATDIITVSPTVTRKSVSDAYALVADRADALAAIDVGDSVTVKNAMRRVAKRNVPTYVATGTDILDGTFRTIR